MNTQPKHAKCILSRKGILSTKCIPARNAATVIFSLVLWTGCLGRVNEAKAWETIAISNAAELRDALKAINPGTVLRLAPGEYGSGYQVRDAKDLTLEGIPQSDPPTFTGGNVAIQFSNCSGLLVRRLSIRGQRDNGLNLDDGGGAQRPREITIEDVSISEIGPKGNHDGIKCSGLEDLTIRNCELRGWGGQGVDLVGCHKVLISGCTLKGVEGFSASAGIQIKGGSSKVTVEGCTLIAAGERPINAGGSTGADYFRPLDANSEASDVVIRGNQIQGGACAVAFVGIDGGVFEDNTVLFPERWMIRILQENSGPAMVVCRDVEVRGNRFVFKRGMLREDINIGPGTASETFRFERNHWYAEDMPNRSKPRLPTEEVSGIYGTDPR